MDNYQNKLIVNNSINNLLNEINHSLNECNSFYFNVAFVTFGGIQLLLNTLKQAEKSLKKGKILTSTYLDFTEPKALEKLLEFQNIESKVYVPTKTKGFHSKAYIFEYDNYYKFIIGSSNLTNNALKSNVEWSTETVAKKNAKYTEIILKEFNLLWEQAEELSNTFINSYATHRDNNFYNYPVLFQKQNLILEANATYSNPNHIFMNRMQEKATESLEQLINYGEQKALVIAATGTGKTYMSAFHVKNFKPKRLLFIVHREDILRKARDTFQTIMDEHVSNFGLLTMNFKDLDAKYLFATINSISNYLNYYPKDYFDYIIIDEAHHSTSPTYQNVISYFNPKFLLGMTATPERSDGGNVYDVFNNNIAIEVRLHEALEDDLVVPFHYFGIKDIEEINLKDIDINDYQKIAKALMINHRTDFIIENMLFYGFNGTKRKCLGFCATIEHAKFMTKEFINRGFNATFLTGNDTINDRIKVINRLEDETDPLEFIFVVDIFNEGVDIPSVNLVLMLRPTESPIVFIQQLGRGLRKYKDKEFLTVIDFIGNHTKTFLIALALNGQKYYDKESLKMAVKTNFANIPGSTYVQIDEISKNTILQQIDKENFNSSKYLKEEYNEFKKILGGKIPYKLVNFLTVDGAPNPLKFIQWKDTYLQFIDYMEKEHQYKSIILNHEFIRLLRYISTLLPIKRIHEFLCLKLLLTTNEINVHSVINLSKKYVSNIDSETILHAFKTLNHDFYDSGEKNRYLPIVSLHGEHLIRNAFLNSILANRELKEILDDLINYGLYTYKNKFGSTNYGTPHLKLYEQYSMRDLALLSNNEKTHSAFRGQGVVKTNNHYFCFIDLHKDENTEERLKYKDKFLSASMFQWQSPNTTPSHSDMGLDLRFPQERGKHIHLFVRKYKKIDSKTEPYIYIGEGLPLSSVGEKPITITFQLIHSLTEELFYELTEQF